MSNFRNWVNGKQQTGYNGFQNIMSGLSGDTFNRNNLIGQTQSKELNQRYSKYTTPDGRQFFFDRKLNKLIGANNQAQPNDTVQRFPV